MKKILKLMLVMLMVVSFTACFGGDSTDEQKEVVENFFEYVSKCQFDKLDDIAEKSVIDSFGLDSMEASLNRYDADTYGQVFVDETEEFKKEVFKNLFTDVKVGDIEVDKDTATVKVTCQYLDYSSITLDTSIIKDLQETYIESNKEELAKIYREKGLTAYQIKIFDNIAPQYYDKMKETVKTAKPTDLTATFKLEKKDAKWMITSITD